MNFRQRMSINSLDVDLNGPTDSGTELAPNRRHVPSWTKNNPVKCSIYASTGMSELKVASDISFSVQGNNWTYNLN